MQNYAQHANKSVDQVVESLFKDYIEKPVEYMQTEKESVYAFSRLLTEYMKEAIYDLEDISKSDEAKKDDKDMTRVFRALNRDHLANSKLLTELHRVYKDK